VLGADDVVALGVTAGAAASSGAIDCRKRSGTAIGAAAFALLDACVRTHVSCNAISHTRAHACGTAPHMCDTTTQRNLHTHQLPEFAASRVQLRVLVKRVLCLCCS
jgi:hypothetical protein